MIKIIESANINELDSNIQKVINEIMIPLADNVKVSYVDESSMPDEISIEFVWEYQPGLEEYIGTWEVDMNKEDIADYSNYLSDLSAEIQAAYSFIEDANDDSDGE